MARRTVGHGGYRLHLVIAASCTHPSTSARTAQRTPPPAAMKALYPTSHDIPSLSEDARALKIARHSPCSVCTAEFCPGLHPPPVIELVLDSDAAYGGDYLASCACGHDASEHGADLHELGVEEFERRARVAVRMDELLQVSGQRALGASSGGAHPFCR